MHTNGRSSVSRRHSRIQPLPWNDHPHAHWEDVSWWWDEIPGYEPWTWADWQDAWSDITLTVVWSVWRNQGARIYAVHRDKPLKDDLQSWLVVKAQEAATRFIPDPSHPAPDRQWGAYLSRTLNAQARHHFEDVVGVWKGAREAWNAGIVSTDHLDELEAETGRTIGRHALHGRPFGVEDPAQVLIRIEELTRQANELAAAGQDGTYTTVSETCLVNLCQNPAKVRGLCDTHWRKERDLTGNLERPCNVPDCRGTHKGRGLCSAHHQAWRAGTLPAELHQYVEAEGRKPGPKAKYLTCTEDQCDKKPKARGLCAMHYSRWQRASKKHETAPPSDSIPA